MVSLHCHQDIKIMLLPANAMQLWEGNVFSRVCLSFHRGSHMTINHDALDLTIQGIPSS